MISPVNPQLIINTFALSAVQTAIYSGSIRPTNPDLPVETIFKGRTLNTPVFSDLQFAPLSDGTIHEYPIDTVLFNVQQSKNIVKTPVSGRNGTIKEFIGESDYEINIKGVICGERGQYPAEAVDNLRRFLKHNLSVGIYSSYLNDRFDIDEITIYDYRIPQEEGKYNQQSFEIMAWSDFPVEILIQQQK